MPPYKNVVRTGERWLVYCEDTNVWCGATVTHVGGRVATLTLDARQRFDGEFLLVPLERLLSDPERFRFQRPPGTGGDPPP